MSRSSVADVWCDFTLFIALFYSLVYSMHLIMTDYDYDGSLNYL
jgi:hypothetical protein